MGKGFDLIPPKRGFQHWDSNESILKRAWAGGRRLSERGHSVRIRMEEWSRQGHLHLLAQRLLDLSLPGLSHFPQAKRLKVEPKSNQVLLPESCCEVSEQPSHGPTTLFDQKKSSPFASHNMGPSFLKTSWTSSVLPSQWPTHFLHQILPKSSKLGSFPTFRFQINSSLLCC